MSPKYWLQEIRMSASAQMLLQKKSSKEIASRLAFSDAPHFVREFKRHYGCTPQSYLRGASARSAARSEVSSEWRALEQESQGALLHPRDERALLATHRERVVAFSFDDKASNDLPLPVIGRPKLRPVESVSQA
jgi:AraC-like DNA-binding protein